jgi:D-methionine transport system ATP-binding protein
MIDIRNMSKFFGDQKVLQGVNLRIPKGSIFGLAGRSGAGKSTLLRCINGLLPYDAGELFVDGVEISCLQGRQMRIFRKEIGMIFQNFSLLERLSVFDNIALPMRCWKSDETTINKKVNELIELVGLTEKSGHKPRELSGGQKQRVAIARALTLEPKILLCDEATSALDPKTAQEILSLLKVIKRQIPITIVMVTHQMSVLKNACEQVAILENGRLAICDSVQNVFNKRPDALRNLLGDSNDTSLMGQQPLKTTIILHCNQFDPARLAGELGIDIVFLGSLQDRQNFSENQMALSIDNVHLPMLNDYLNTHRVMWSFPHECDEASLTLN